MVDSHLFGIIFFKPGIFLNLIMDKENCQLTSNFYGFFAILTVVEPCLCPPACFSSVGIDTDLSGNVEALHIKVQFREWVYDSAVADGVIEGFFFRSSLIVDR